MKNRIEISKNADGRVEEGKILFGARAELAFNNEWDDEGFLRAINFSGQKKNLPSPTELYWLMNEKFVEQIRKIDLIKEIELIQRIDEVHVASASLQNVVQGFNFTERWEKGYFNRTKFFGRTEPFYKSEAEEPPPYNVPPMVKGINTVQPLPWNNAIWMRNSKDGMTHDEIYFGIPLAFNKAVLRIDALLPTIAQIAAIDDIVAWGFEVCSQGSTTALYVIGHNGGYNLVANYQGPTGGGIYEAVVLNLPNTNTWSTYWLEINPPIIRLIEYFAGAYIVRGEVVLREPSLGEWFACPFFCNESETNIVSNFYIGNISVWALTGRPLPAHAESVANTALDVYIETMSTRSITLRVGVTAGTMIGNTSVYVSVDNATWSLADTIVNGAVAYYFRAYDDDHHSTTKPTNVAAWPFVKITIDAQGAGKIGTIEWALK